MGVWGTTPMNTGASQVFIEGDPQRFFRASDRSERHNASPPRRAEPQRRNEVSHKVLCQAFFQESARRFRRSWGIIERKKDTRGRAASSTLPRI